MTNNKKWNNYRAKYYRAKTDANRTSQRKAGEIRDSK